MTGTPGTGSASEATLAVILSELDDNKAEDIVQIDLRGKTCFYSYGLDVLFPVAEGDS